MKKLLPLIAASAHLLIAQSEFSFSPHFERLMGEPRELVAALRTLPWKSTLPSTLTGLERRAGGPTIRVASVDRPVANAGRRLHFASPDGDVWVDILELPRNETRNLLGGALQPHSGILDAEQVLVFTNHGSAGKEALGAAVFNSGRFLLNAGMGLPFAVRAKAAPEADLRAMHAAIDRFQALVAELARAFLDPAYADFSPKIAPKPEAVRLLRLAGFARFWSEVKYNFVYLEKRPDVDWEALLERYLPRIAAAKDDIEYGRILEEAVALLKDGHTNVYPHARPRLDGPPLVLEPIEGKPVVTVVGNLPELAALRPGMELLEIDGTPLSTIIARDIDPYIATGTIQDRRLRQMRALLRAAPDSTLKTKWLALDGKTIDVELKCDSSKRRGALPSRTMTRFEYRELPGGIAYMALNTFDDSRIVKDFEASYEKARDARAWILDLRDNGGGSSDIGYAILKHTLRAPTKTMAERIRIYRPTWKAWGRPQDWQEIEPKTIEPAQGPRFDGPVFILTSPITCSAAEDFLISARTAKRATIVGEPTCGSSGQPLYFSIYGADVRICTKWDRFPDGAEYVGIGILPDVPAARTRRDVAVGRDAVLEKALELIR